MSALLASQAGKVARKGAKKKKTLAALPEKKLILKSPRELAVTKAFAPLREKIKKDD